MHSLWDELVRSRAFWEAYVACGLWPEPPRPTTLDINRVLWTEPSSAVSLDFSFPERHTLQIFVGMDGSRLLHWDRDLRAGRHMLSTVDHDGKTDLFRWEEFQAIVRHLAKACSPVWAVELLFCMYVAVTPDIMDEWAGLLRRCVEAAGVFTNAEVEYIVAEYRRQCGLRTPRWIETPGLGWVVEDGFSTRRDDKYTELDFARFNRFLQALAQDA